MFLPPLTHEQEWIVKEFKEPGPGRGYWYECCRVKAMTREEALKKAFPPDGRIPPRHCLEIA